MLMRSCQAFDFSASEVISRFNALPIDCIDREIGNCVRHVHDSLSFLHSGFMEYSSDSQTLVETHFCRVEQEKAPVNYPRVVKDELPYLMWKLKTGDMMVFSNPKELPKEASEEKRVATEVMGTKSVVFIPLRVDDEILGALYVSYGDSYRWPDNVVERLRVVSEILSVALYRKRIQTALQKSFSQIEELKARMKAESLCPLEEIELAHAHPEIIGQSEALRRVLVRAEQVAPTSSTVLITGETGTGKELLARAIHGLSPRRNRRMVTVNCSAMPQSLFEDEFFGHEKGAFSGALSRRIGRFEIADGSTIFLDEVGDLPLDMQCKLLRVLEEGQFERLGSSKTLTVNVRVIAATNKDLSKAVRAGQFREDLYHRLHIFPILLPPLRERLEDIPDLIKAFSLEFNEQMGKSVAIVPQRSLEALRRYHWPGNIRELRNQVEQAMIVSRGPALQIQTPETAAPDALATKSLDDVQKEHIMKVLERTGGRVFGEKGAARILDINPKTLQSRMKKLGIKRPLRTPA